MKLSDLLKPRIERRFERPPRTDAPMQPQRCAGEIPKPPAFDPRGPFSSPTPPFRPKPSKSEFEARELFKEFNDCLPTRESFKKTDLYKAMKEAKANGH